MASFTLRYDYEENEHPDAGALRDSADLPQTATPTHDWTRNDVVEMDPKTFGLSYDNSYAAGYPTKRPRPDSREASESRRQQVLNWMRKDASAAQVDQIWAFIQGFKIGDEVGFGQNTSTAQNNGFGRMIPTLDPQPNSIDEIPLPSSNSVPTDFAPYFDLQLGPGNEPDAELDFDIPIVHLNHSAEFVAHNSIRNVETYGDERHETHTLSFQPSIDTDPIFVGPSFWNRNIRSSRQDLSRESTQSNSSGGSRSTSRSISTKHSSTTTDGSQFSNPSRNKPLKGAKESPLAFAKSTTTLVTKADTPPNSSFKCSISGCDKILGREADLRRHLRTIHSGLVYVCPKSDDGCQRQIRRIDKIKEHLRDHHKMMEVEVAALDLESWRQPGNPEGKRRLLQTLSIGFQAKRRSQARDAEQEDESIADLRRGIKCASLELDPLAEEPQLNNGDGNAREGSRAEAERVALKDDDKVYGLSGKLDPWTILLGDGITFSGG